MVLRPWPRFILCALVWLPAVLLLILIPLASFLASGWSNRLIAIGLALEIAGAWAGLVRPLAEDSDSLPEWLGGKLFFGATFGFEPDMKTRQMPSIGLSLLLLGFVLQFVSTVFK